MVFRFVFIVFFSIDPWLISGVLHRHDRHLLCRRRRRDHHHHHGSFQPHHVRRRHD
jgi:hypothetical protein